MIESNGTITKEEKKQGYKNQLKLIQTEEVLTKNNINSKLNMNSDFNNSERLSQYRYFLKGYMEDKNQTNVFQITNRQLNLLIDILVNMDNMNELKPGTKLGQLFSGVKNIDIYFENITAIIINHSKESEEEIIKKIIGLLKDPEKAQSGKLYYEEVNNKTFNRRFNETDLEHYYISSFKNKDHFKTTFPEEEGGKPNKEGLEYIKMKEKERTVEDLMKEHYNYLAKWNQRPSETYIKKIKSIEEKTLEISKAIQKTIEGEEDALGLEGIFKEISKLQEKPDKEISAKEDKVDEGIIEHVKNLKKEYAKQLLKSNQLHYIYNVEIKKEIKKEIEDDKELKDLKGEGLKERIAEILEGKERNLTEKIEGEEIALEYRKKLKYTKEIMLAKITKNTTMDKFIESINGLKEQNKTTIEKQQQQDINFIYGILGKNQEIERFVGNKEDTEELETLKTLYNLAMGEIENYKKDGSSVLDKNVKKVESYLTVMNAKRITGDKNTSQDYIKEQTAIIRYILSDFDTKKLSEESKKIINRKNEKDKFEKLMLDYKELQKVNEVNSFMKKKLNQISNKKDLEYDVENKGLFIRYEKSKPKHILEETSTTINEAQGLLLANETKIKTLRDFKEVNEEDQEKIIKQLIEKFKKEENWKKTTRKEEILIILNFLQKNQDKYDTEIVKDTIKILPQIKSFGLIEDFKEVNEIIKKGNWQQGEITQIKEYIDKLYLVREINYNNDEDRYKEGLKNGTILSPSKKNQEKNNKEIEDFKTNQLYNIFQTSGKNIKNNDKRIESAGILKQNKTGHYNQFKTKKLLEKFQKGKTKNYTFQERLGQSLKTTSKINTIIKLDYPSIKIKNGEKKVFNSNYIKSLKTNLLETGSARASKVIYTLIVDQNQELDKYINEPENKKQNITFLAKNLLQLVSPDGKDVDSLSNEEKQEKQELLNILTSDSEPINVSENVKIMYHQFQEYVYTIKEQLDENITTIKKEQKNPTTKKIAVGLFKGYEEDNIYETNNGLIRNRQNYIDNIDINLPEKQQTIQEIFNGIEVQNQISKNKDQNQKFFNTYGRLLFILGNLNKTCKDQTEVETQLKLILGIEGEVLTEFYNKFYNDKINDEDMYNEMNLFFHNEESKKLREQIQKNRGQFNFKEYHANETNENDKIKKLLSKHNNSLKKEAKTQYLKKHQYAKRLKRQETLQQKRMSGRNDNITAEKMESIFIDVFDKALLTGGQEKVSITQMKQDTQKLFEELKTTNHTTEDFYKIVIGKLKEESKYGENTIELVEQSLAEKIDPNNKEETRLKIQSLKELEENSNENLFIMGELDQKIQGRELKAQEEKQTLNEVRRQKHPERLKEIKENKKENSWKQIKNKIKNVSNKQGLMSKWGRGVMDKTNSFSPFKMLGSTLGNITSFAGGEMDRLLGELKPSSMNVNVNFQRMAETGNSKFQTGYEFVASRGEEVKENFIYNTILQNKMGKTDEEIRWLKASSQERWEIEKEHEKEDLFQLLIDCREEDKQEMLKDMMNLDSIKEPKYKKQMEELRHQLFNDVKIPKPKRMTGKTEQNWEQEIKSFRANMRTTVHKNLTEMSGSKEKKVEQLTKIIKMVTGTENKDKVNEVINQISDKKDLVRYLNENKGKNILESLSNSDVLISILVGQRELIRRDRENKIEDINKQQWWKIQKQINENRQTVEDIKEIDITDVYDKIKLDNLDIIKDLTKEGLEEIMKIEVIKDKEYSEVEFKSILKFIICDEELPKELGKKIELKELKELKETITNEKVGFLQGVLGLNYAETNYVANYSKKIKKIEEETIDIIKINQEIKEELDQIKKYEEEKRVNSGTTQVYMVSYEKLIKKLSETPEVVGEKSDKLSKFLLELGELNYKQKSNIEVGVDVRKAKEKTTRTWEEKIDFFETELAKNGNEKLKVLYEGNKSVITSSKGKQQTSIDSEVKKLITDITDMEPAKDELYNKDKFNNYFKIINNEKKDQEVQSNRNIIR